MTRGGRALALLPALLPVLLLAGCGEGHDEGDTSEVVVEVGEEFRWNGFVVDEGWKVTAKETDVAGQPFTQATISGRVTNDGESVRFAVFQVAFGADGQLISEVNCTSTDELAPGDSADLDCPGLGQAYPEGYDRVVVREIER